MKFTIKNLLGRHRSIPAQGNYAIPIGPYETIELDYPFGAEGFFEKLVNYDYEVIKEASALDEKIMSRFKYLESLRPSGYDRYVEAEKKAAEAQGDQNSTGKLTGSGESMTEEEENDESGSNSQPDSTPNTLLNSSVTSAPDLTEAPIDSNEESSKLLTKEEILELCKDLTAEQLRALLKEIGITSTSNNITTLIGKISNSSATEEELNSAYNKIIATA